MNRNYRNTFRKITLLAAGTALASAGVLWSWNTLAPLFGGPTFQFRHAVAVLVALVALRVVLGRSVRSRRHAPENEVHS